MSEITYNGVELVPAVNVPVPEGLSDVVIPSDVEVTYITALHSGKKDFDPAGRNLVKSADAVFHEEFAWPRAAHLAINALANGISRSPDSFTRADRNSYSWQRLSVIQNTNVPQFFWDASDKEALDHNLPVLMNAYRQSFVEAEDLMRAKEPETALDMMARASILLAAYGAERDGIGVTRIAKIVNERSDTIKRIVVFAGTAHIYQAIHMAQLRNDSNESAPIKITSMLEDPFADHVTHHGEARNGNPTGSLLVKSWLFNQMTTELRVKQPYRSATAISNELNKVVKAMSDDEALAKLTSYYP